MKYVERQCQEFLKLGLQGHTIMFASGDYGVASFPGDGGNSNGCLGPDSRIFNPQYPSGCPYVTSVSGTMLYPGQAVTDAESVMQVNLGGSAVNFSSAGGFSNYFEKPWYQAEAIEEYFRVGNPSYPYYSELNVDVNTTTGLYNRIGRGIPDIAANGAYFESYLDGELVHFFGSSLASPLFASVITLVSSGLFFQHLSYSVPLTSARLTRSVSQLESPPSVSSTRFSTPTLGRSTISPTELTWVATPRDSRLLKAGTQLLASEVPTMPSSRSCSSLCLRFCPLFVDYLREGWVNDIGAVLQ